MKLALNNKGDLNFKIILISLLFLELLSCYFAYFTLGEVKQFLFILILFLNVIPFLFYYLRKKVTSLFFAFIIGLVIIPYQSFLVFKWFTLKNESATLIAYIDNYKSKNGEFPESIADYSFENQKLTRNFSYHLQSNDYRLYYYIGTKGTTHFYSSKINKWEYYPD
ncbi:hypothetical protein [uncultured Polaribacter sp.]|uniref:hypothetical protein n=1 Tax=uncultured Polaribacter sp. TaxID=174711 RepID=UPI00263749C2|nr:hypothetical protein [uncultured Polaribacter sp.]